MHPFESLQILEVGVSIHWFGQNSFALKDARETMVIVDPYFPRFRPAGEFIHPISPVDEGALRTDYVLLTHEIPGRRRMGEQYG